MITRNIFILTIVLFAIFLITILISNYPNTKLVVISKDQKIFNTNEILKDNNIVEAAHNRQNSNSKRRHVFLDLGTNNGDSTKFFVDKAKNAMLNAKSSESNKILQGYGALENKKWEIYAIEANPYFNKILADVKVHCEKLGHEFHLYTETAAWTKNEKLIFYLDTVNVNRGFWGSSLNKHHPDVVSSGYNNVTVNAVDISEILKKYRSDDEIIMKMDIEGAEYRILLHLIKDGTLNLIDMIAVEYHPWFFNKKTSETIGTLEKLRNFFNDYFNFFNVKLVDWYQVRFKLLNNLNKFIY